MNKANNVLIGVLTSFDKISHTGEIRIVDTDGVVYISKKYSLINPIFFELVGELEFQFTFTEFANKNYFQTHLINNHEQKELKKKILIRFITKKKGESLIINELVEQIGFVRDGTRALFEELQEEKILNYRIVGQGEIKVDLLTNNKDSIKEKVKNFSIEELYTLSNKLSLLQKIEFQKSMDIDAIRLKFLTLSWDEIIKLINLRLEINQGEYKKDIKNFVSSNDLVGSRDSQSSDDIERDENLFNFGIAETNTERATRLKKIRSEQKAKAKAIKDEQEKNQVETGYLETNSERAQREKREKILEERRIAQEQEEKKLIKEREANYAKTGTYESDNERIQRENLSDSIEVDVDQLNKRRKYGDKKREFVKNLSIGESLEAEIIYVTDRVYWVEVDGIKAMMPKVVVSSHLGDFGEGETVPVEVINIDLKRLHITVKPISKNKRKKPAVKKPAVKKPAVKKPAVKKPAVKKPAVKKPAVKKPAVKKPAVKTKDSKLHDFFETYLLSSKNKQTTKLFGEYTKQALNIYGPEETSLTFPVNKKKVRLINSGIESAWINSEGLMTVVINDHNATADILNLIDKFVEQKNRKNCYKKLPEAVPLFIPHEFVRKYKSTLKKSFDIFLKYCEKTGKNPWKKYHDPEIVSYLNKVQLKKIKFIS